MSEVPGFDSKEFEAGFVDHSIVDILTPFKVILNKRDRSAPPVT